METSIAPNRSKTRIVAEIDPDMARALKRLRAETDRPMCEIVEEALRRHFETLAEPKDEPS